MVSNSSYKNLGVGYVGGLVGLNSYGNITQCYSNSNVSSNYEMGGLIGTDSFGKITKCYSTGSVTNVANLASWHIGGLIGSCTKRFISQCYSISLLNGRDAQGLLGQQNETIMTACFWDIETSEVTTSITGGIGKTTTEMKTRSTFVNAGWDFSDETTNGT